MKKQGVCPDDKRLWQLEFALTGPVTGTVLEFCAQEQPFLTVTASPEGLQAEAVTRWEQTTPRFGESPVFRFSLKAAPAPGRYTLVWLDHAFRLYRNGRLEDEDWPLGTLPGGSWTLTHADEAQISALSAPDAVPDSPAETLSRPFQYFEPDGRNTGVGDCMPFVHDGRFCLFYLSDRRGHGSKLGLGAHQWAQISSSDLIQWTEHPMAIGITEQWEGSVCTGSLIEKDGVIYAYYAARMSDGSPARLTWAESTDGVHFAKSGQYFSLTAPYEPVSARDPMVFAGADGQYHMLVTTSLADEGLYGGCLAHLTSSDLRTWTQQAPFLVPGYDRQPECADYFEWNGWYYLFFSTLGAAHYRFSRHPFGPWECPANDRPDALEKRVPKTAELGGRRFSVGFLDRRPRSYAGSAVTHELFQRADGTLGVRRPEELVPPMPRRAVQDDIRLVPGQGRACERIAAVQGAFRMKTVLKTDGNAQAGFLLDMGSPDAKPGESGHCYQIRFDPAARTVSVIRPREEMDFGHGRDLLTGVDGMENGIGVDLVVYRDILDLVLSDGHVSVMRLEENADSGAAVSVYAAGGGAFLSETEIRH